MGSGGMVESSRGGLWMGWEATPGGGMGKSMGWYNADIPPTGN